jgi:hypothetical protein
MLGGNNAWMSAMEGQIRNLQNLIPTLDQIEGVMPNQMDMTDLVSSGHLDDIAKEINKDFATFGSASTMEDANKNVNWQSPAEVTQGRGFANQQTENPVLDMPDIMDYTGSMRVPLIENVLNRVGGANPYDTRQNAILQGQESSIDKNYDDAIERVKNQFAVTDDLGSPAYRAAIREVEEGRARDKSAVQSQFQMQAAGLDESMARGRLQDLSSALGGEQGRVYQEMAFQDALQRQANNDYLNFMNQLQSSYYEPQRQRDEGLRYSLAGLGNSVQPNMAAATTGLGAASGSQGDLANALYRQGGGMFNTLVDNYNNRGQ